MIRVRPMAAADRAAVAGMLADLYGAPVAEPGAEGEILVAEDGVLLLGCLALAVRPWGEGTRSAPVPWVEAWYVAPGHRRRGVGRALMRAAEARARAMGFAELGSDAAADNRAGLAAHRALGFVATETVRYFRRDLGDRSGEEGR